jgi:hypothetical protein
MTHEREMGWLESSASDFAVPKSSHTTSGLEKENYAILGALVKWAGWIGLQPVDVWEP